MPPQSSILEDVKRLRAAGAGPSQAQQQPQQPQQSQQSQLPSQPSQQPDPSQAAWLRQQLEGVMTGAVKGAGETAVGAGRAVRAIPGVGSITDALARLVGPEGTDPEAAFSQTNAQMGLGASNTAERVGKFGEQTAELFAGAGPVRKAVIEGGVRMIPNAASPNAMRLMNRLAAIIGRPAGEALNAGTNAMMHGDETPGIPTAIAAAGPVVGEGVAMAAPLMKNPAIQKILGLIAGIMTANATGGMTPLGLGAGFGAYGMGKGMASSAMRSPGAVNTVQRVMRRTLPQLTRMGAAAESQSRRKD